MAQAPRVWGADYGKEKWRYVDSIVTDVGRQPPDRKCFHTEVPEHLLVGGPLEALYLVEEVRRKLPREGVMATLRRKTSASGTAVYRMKITVEPDRPLSRDELMKNNALVLEAGDFQPQGDPRPMINRVLKRAYYGAPVTALLLAVALAWLLFAGRWFGMSDAAMATYWAGFPTLFFGGTVAIIISPLLLSEYMRRRYGAETWRMERPDSPECRAWCARVFANHGLSYSPKEE